MKQVKAVRVNKPETGGRRRSTEDRPSSKEIKTYANTEKIRPRRHNAHHHFDRPGRGGKGYCRSSGTYVAPHYRPRESLAGSAVVSAPLEGIHQPLFWAAFTLTGQWN